MTSRQMDEADRFVHAATRAFAIDGPCPPTPEDGTWVDRATTAGVLPSVVHALRGAGQRLPPHLASLPLLVAARQLRTLQDLSLIGDALASADVPWSVLKGPVLSSVVFKHRHARDYADLDLLVSPAHLRSTVHALVDAGAVMAATDWDTVAAARTAELSLVLKHGTVLDLHWSLFNRGTVRDGFDIATEDLLEKRTERDIDGVTVSTLDDLDLVLHTLAHGCLSGCSSLRWLLDAHQCLRWLSAAPEELAVRARERGLATAVRAVLDSVALHLDDGVRAWAEAVSPPTPWTRMLRVISGRRPPSAPSMSSHSSKTFYAATRSTDLKSFTSLGRTAALTLRYARGGWPEPQPRPASQADAGYERWLRFAEGQR